MCWAFEDCEGSHDPEIHDHCYACADGIPAKKKDGSKQQVCVPQCEEAKILDEMEGSGPVSWCCICGGMGGPGGSRCWGCQ